MYVRPFGSDLKNRWRLMAYIDSDEACDDVRTYVHQYVARYGAQRMRHMTDRLGRTSMASSKGFLDVMTVALKCPPSMIQYLRRYS